MSRLVTRPSRVLVLEGTEAVELHTTLLQGIATQSPLATTLLETGACESNELRADVERLLDMEETNASPPVWRLTQTSEGHLGTPYFATEGQAEVAACGEAHAWVTTEGFTLGTTQATHFSAIEYSPELTCLIDIEGEELDPLSEDEETLARFLAEGHNYVTAVQCSFLGALHQTLYKLRARLLLGSNSRIALV